LLFENNNGSNLDKDQLIEILHKQIGKLSVHNEWLKKALAPDFDFVLFLFNLFFLIKRYSLPSPLPIQKAGRTSQTLLCV